MKKYFFMMLMFSLCASAYAQRTSKFDTNQIKNRLLDFARLSFKRTEVDSMMSFLSFPLYSEGWRGNKTYASFKQFQQEQKTILMRSRFRPLNYAIQSLHQIKNPKKLLIKNNNYSCFQLVTLLAGISPGDEGSYLTTVFYVEKKKPYGVFAIEQR